MNRLFNKIQAFFSVRLFLNVVLWVIVCLEIFASNIPDKHINLVYFSKAISVLSLFLFTYANSLWLVPNYLVRGHRFTYFLLAVLLVIAYALSYSIFITAVVHNNKEIPSYQVVLFTVPAKIGWTVGKIIASSIAYAIVFGVWLFIWTMAWFMHDYSRQRREMLVVQQKQIETELSFLKAQMNPHFLFNTLNNLYALALKKSDKAPDAILKLSAILRYLLYESNAPAVSFEKEKEIMQAYIDIELLRLDNRDQIQFNIGADEPCTIPPLLWLPVLENVFKHGTRTVAGDNHVEYRFEIRSRELFIYSKNKEKMLVKTDVGQGGIGLSNLEKRLKILYPGKYVISATQKDNYYISQVKIQLH